MSPPSFEDVACVVTRIASVDRSRITPGTRLEEDLGMTGDDTVDLLRALEREFGVRFECPHGPEGFDPLGLLRALLRKPSVEIRPVTIGDLHLAILRGQWEDPPWPPS